MNTVINEHKIVQDLNTEYYKLINLYSNLKRQSTFIKYYNLDINKSPKKDVSLESYDYYTKTNNFWDVYDLTPTQIISAIQNTPENNMDLSGQMTVSATTILTYTIENPRVGDLITFYKPSESDEVLRVVNVRLQLNSNFSTVPVKWFELDLETAPIKHSNLERLHINDHYIYDLTVEKNVKYDFYKKYVEKMKGLENLLNKLKKYYISETDLYYHDGYILNELNELIYFIKTNFDNRFYRLFEGIKSPFGYWDRYKFKYNSINEMNLTEDYIFSLKNYQTLENELYYIADHIDQKELNDILLQTIDLLNYIREIGEYIDHTKNN